MRANLLLCLAIIGTTNIARADDWPSFRHDNRRSGVTAERVAVDSLRQAWVWKSPNPPQPAWAGPAKWDAYANLQPLRSMRDYDPVFHPVAVVGAGSEGSCAVFFGSSADDSVYCLDAKTGRVRWIYMTDGPVRIAPTVADGKVYFGSDDGYAYCLDAADGRMHWKHRPVECKRRILNNGRLISMWPCRTGVLVDRGTAYFAVGMLPWQESYLCAVDAATGEPTGPGRYIKNLSGVTMEGALLASAEKLFSPQGRVPPQVFERATGKSLGALDKKGGGGCFVLITDDAHVLHGPGNKTGWISDTDAGTRQRLASFPGGNAMVVAGSTAYLLTDTQLAALDRGSRKPKWSEACDCPFSLILAGDVLFAGGQDRIVALAAQDGKQLWQQDVRGRAYGLAVADGQLLVATDEGHVYCFAPGPKIVPPKPAATPPAAAPLAAIRAIEDKDLVGRWVFQGEAVKNMAVKDLAGSTDGSIVGPVKRLRIDAFEALVLDGQSNHVSLAKDHNRAKLPQRAISAEAWVRVDRPLQWGGIVGAIQDNGDYERGWILGYSNRRFSFAVCGKEGPHRLTYLTADADFQPGQWYHVVGTYDGASLKVYVDGRLAGTSDAQRGPIDYPPKAFYDIGAYHDDDELFRLAGAIHEVRVFGRALTAEEVRSHTESKNLSSPPPKPEAETVDLAIGPYLQFTTPDSAVVRWRTEQPSPSVLRYTDGYDIVKIEDSAATAEHEATLTGLRRNRVYRYAIESMVDGKQATTREFECDTFFNYTQPAAANGPLPILDTAGVRDGICVVIGDGLLAYHLARHSRMRVIGLETDARIVAASREALKRAGLYGARAAVHRVGSLKELPIVGNFADLVVVAHPDATAEGDRLLKPGGVRLTRDGKGKWQRLKRPPIDGGVWSHQYGLADNSGYGGESLGGAGSVDDLAVQWIGRPGPRAQADRNGRKPSPLSTGGRLFMQGLHRMIALDAYNGTILWSLELPHFERFNMPRDCSNWCADERHVFAAMRNKCWQIDAADGKVSRFYSVPNNEDKEYKYDWGYIASDGKRLIGSAVRRGTSWTNFWGGGSAGWYDSTGGEVTFKICSDRLFSIEKRPGDGPANTPRKARWTYDGLVINPTITITGGRIYFVECRNAKVVQSESRRVGMPELWQDQFLVALDTATGRKVWEKPLDTADGSVVFYMAAAEGRLVIVSSDSKYNAYAFDVRDGAPLWDVHFDWPGKDHGKHMSRPAIHGGKVFVRPKVIDLFDGKLLDVAMPGGGCGTYALTDKLVIFRAGNVTLWDSNANRTTAWSRLRPGCWLSTIPAAGMLLSPEAGGGCSCGNWLETSIGFAPVGQGLP